MMLPASGKYHGNCKGYSEALFEATLLQSWYKQGEIIGIDEFAVAKGHIYKTIVVDLDTKRVIYTARVKMRIP